MFERYVNFDFYKTALTATDHKDPFERYVNFDFYKTFAIVLSKPPSFERYVNFDFYKTTELHAVQTHCLRDM